MGDLDNSNKAVAKRDERNTFENLDILLRKIEQNERYIANITVLSSKVDNSREPQDSVGSELRKGESLNTTQERSVNGDLLYLIEKAQRQQSDLDNIQRRLQKSLGQGELLQDTNF